MNYLRDTHISNANPKRLFHLIFGITVWQKPGQALPQHVLDTRCLGKPRAIVKKNLLASDLKKSLKSNSLVSATLNGYPGSFDTYCLNSMAVIAIVL